jgi:flagellin
MLQRMRELAVQAANGTNDTDDIANLNKEFAALATEIDRVADSTEFNGIAVLKGDILNDQLEFIVGQDTSSVNKMTVAFSDFNLTDGASKVDEVLGSEVLAKTVGAQGTLGADLTSGIFVTDGTTSISVDLADVRVAANNATIAATDATLANVAKALQTKATANSAFLLTISEDVGTGLKFIEKAGSGDVVDTAGDNAKYTGASSATTAFTFVGAVAGTGTGVMGVNLSSYKTTGSGFDVNTSTTVGQIDTAIKGVAQARADFGAVINTLEHSVDNLNVAIQNTTAARSAIMDADYAAETTELARTQIISQAATAMLSQANQQAQSVLALLK